MTTPSLTLASRLRPWRAPFALAAALVAGAFTATPASAASSAAVDAPTTEEQVVAIWLEHGLEVASLRSKVGVARFDLVTAGLWPNPQAAISASPLLAGTATNG